MNKRNKLLILRGGKRMAKLGDFKTPTGGSGNILNPMDWIAFILGAVVLIVTFAVGQNFANKMGGRIPGVDATIEQPWKSEPARPVTNEKARVIL
jgi:hypothetical protein